MNGKGEAFRTALISNDEFLAAEVSFEIDLDNDGWVGKPQFVGRVVTSGVTRFGTTDSGFYGFKPTLTSSTVLIPNAWNPGNGWKGLGVTAVSGTQYWFFLKNEFSNQYSRWDLNEKGAALKTGSISYEDFP
jgi:hypothetical protein